MTLDSRIVNVMSLSTPSRDYSDSKEGVTNANVDLGIVSSITIFPRLGEIMFQARVNRIEYLPSRKVEKFLFD